MEERPILVGWLLLRCPHSSHGLRLLPKEVCEGEHLLSRQNCWTLEHASVRTENRFFYDSAATIALLEGTLIKSSESEEP